MNASPLTCAPWLLGLVVVLGLTSSSCPAQTPWEITPYRCRVWVCTAQHPLFTASYRAQLQVQLQQQLQAWTGAVWELQVTEAEPAISRLADQPTHRWGKAAWLTTSTDAYLGKVDKVWIVRLDANARQIAMTVAELDVPSRQLGAPVQVAYAGGDHLARHMADAILNTFTPLAAIHRVEQENVELRVKGADLLPTMSARVSVEPVDSPHQTTATHPGSLEIGALLQPIVIPYDPAGNVRSESIRVIPWTVLEVKEQLPRGLRATLVSGYGRPLNARRSRRVAQVAQRLRVNHPTTEIRLVNKQTPPRPLVGYEFVAATEQFEPGSGEPGSVLGTTDATGSVQLTAQGDSLQRVLVRHGKHTLATLPLVVGAASHIELPFTDDDDRLEIEGYVQGVMDRLTDVVAQRTLLAARVRAQLQAGNTTEAQALIDQFRKLDSRSEFQERIQRRQRMLAGQNRQLQTRAIDRLFAETRQLFEDYLDPQLPQRLSEELRNQPRARTPGPSTTPPPTPNTPAPNTPAPNTPAPNTTAPNTTAPNTTAPNTTAPKATLPDNASQDIEPQ